MHLKKSFWKMDGWAWAALVACIVIPSWIVYDYKTRSDIKKEDVTVNMQPVVVQPEIQISVTATQYSKDYENNEVSADEKYRGKFLKITGTVAAVTKSLDEIFIRLNAEGFLIEDVYCFVKDAETVIHLKKGDKIDFVGYGTGKNYWGPSITDAQLLK